MAMRFFVPPMLLAEVGPAFQVACAVNSRSGWRREPVRTDAHHGASQANRLALVVRMGQEPGRWPLRPVNALLVEGSGGDGLLPRREGVLCSRPTTGQD